VSVAGDIADLGKLLTQSSDTPYEARGRPAIEAQAGLSALANSYGYDHARDKGLNRALLDALLPFMNALEPGVGLSWHQGVTHALAPDPLAGVVVAYAEGALAP